MCSAPASSSHYSNSNAEEKRGKGISRGGRAAISVTRQARQGSRYCACGRWCNVTEPQSEEKEKRG